MMNKLTVGLIGAGRIGKVHALSILKNLPSVTVKGVTDTIAGRAESLAADTGIANVYGDYREMLADGDIEAVLVCSSTDTHTEIVRAAAGAGKHIFCEKPLDTDVGRVKETLKRVGDAGVKLQIGFNRRFDHNFSKLKELILAGAIGDLHILKITSRDPLPPPIEYVKVSGGIYVDMSIHDFDMARFLAESEPEEVYTAAACLIDRDIAAAGDVDTALMTVKFKSGAICCIDNSRKAAYGYDQRVEAFGAKGKAEAGNDLPSAVVLSTEDGVLSEKPFYFFLERYMQSYAEEIKQFTEAIINRTEVPVTGEDFLCALRLSLAAAKSARENRPVRISEIE